MGSRFLAEDLAGRFGAIGASKLTIPTGQSVRLFLSQIITRRRSDKCIKILGPPSNRTRLLLYNSQRPQMTGQGECAPNRLRLRRGLDGRLNDSHMPGSKA